MPHPTAKPWMDDPVWPMPEDEMLGSFSGPLAAHPAMNHGDDTIAAKAFIDGLPLGLVLSDLFQKVHKFRGFQGQCRDDANIRPMRGRCNGLEASVGLPTFRLAAHRFTDSLCWIIETARQSS